MNLGEEELAERIKGDHGDDLDQTMRKGFNHGLSVVSLVRHWWTLVSQYQANFVQSIEEVRL